MIEFQLVGIVENRPVLITSMGEIISLIGDRVNSNEDTFAGVNRQIEVTMALLLTSIALGDAGLRLGLNHILRWLRFDSARLTITAIDGLRLATPVSVEYPLLQKATREAWIQNRYNADYPDNTTDGATIKDE